MTKRKNDSGATWNVLDCDVEKLCRYITDDGAVASYWGISRKRVEAIRANMGDPKRNPKRFLDSRAEPDGTADGRTAHVVTRNLAEAASEQLRAAIVRTGQCIEPEPPKRRLTFEEQLALVASGRVGIVDMGGRA